MSNTEDTAITELPEPIDPALALAAVREERDAIQRDLMKTTLKLADTHSLLNNQRDAAERAGLRADRFREQINEQRTFRWGLAGSLVVLALLIGAILFGCDRSNDRQHETIQACVTAGGTWVDGAAGGECLRLKATGLQLR